MSEELQAVIALYEEKLVAAAQLKQEINALKTKLTQWLKTVPSQVIDRPNGKMKLTERKSKSPLNRQYLEESLFQLFTNNIKMPSEQAKEFAEKAASIIWSGRPEKTNTRLLRTFNKKRKRVDNMIEMEEDAAVESE